MLEKTLVKARVGCVSWRNTAKVYDARPYSESFAEREAAEAKR